MDVAILADTSKSMTKEHRDELVKLVNKMLDKWGVSPDGNHYSLIAFDAVVKIPISFEDLHYYDKSNLLSKVEKTIQTVPGKGKWGTRSDIALDEAASKLFDEDKGDRPEAKNILFMFTDGKPFKARKDRKPWRPFGESTAKLEVSQPFLKVQVKNSGNAVKVITNRLNRLYN